MTNLETVKIVAEPHKTQVFIGDKEIRGVKKLELTQEVGYPIPMLHLDLIAEKVMFEGTAEPELNYEEPKD